MRLSPVNITTLFLVALSGTAQHVEATFTIGGVDLTTGHIGSAGTTCVDPGLFTLYSINYRRVAQKGLVLAQAFPPEEGSLVFDKIDELLEADEDCSTILETITDPAFDDAALPVTENVSVPLYVLRQYACLNYRGQAEAYTGADLDEFYEALGSAEWQPSAQLDMAFPEGTQGAPTNFAFSAQQNAVSLNTVPLLADNFLSGEGCDLAQRLFDAITSVDDANTEARTQNATEDTNFEGDVRCEYGAMGGATPGYVFHPDVVFMG